MRKFLMSAAMAASVLSAAPAMAQYNGNGNGNGYPPPPPHGQGYPGGPGYGRPGQVSPWQLRDMVEHAIQRREVNWRDARELRAQVNNIIQIAQRSRYSNNDPQRYEVQRRTDQVLQRLRYARQNGGYNDGRGYDDRSRHDDDRRGYDNRDDHRGYDNGDGYRNDPR